MEQAKLKQLILKVLKKDERLWNEDKTELNQTLLLDLVENIDEKVIDLLLQEKDLREKFFVKIKDIYVFKTNDFRFFMEENKVDNSYTDYKNRIGLTDGKKFLKDTNDVVLDFPYKDCVLEGGQSNEEGEDVYFEYDETVTKAQEKQGLKAGTYNQKTAKRKEIFFNSVLAHDEIDRLFDHKALTNWKRFTKDGEQEVKEIERDEDGTIKENLIIKGNNLLALHSLKKQFAGKVKLIYIDPPYNTGGTGDTFTYNNYFKLSTWLTFMKNRFECAKELLKEDGSIVVAIDKYMQEYLGILVKETFDQNKFEVNCIVVQHNPTGTQGNNFSYTHEFAYFITPANTTYLTSVSNEDAAPASFRDWGKETSKRESAKTCFYPIYVKEDKIIGFGDVCSKSFHPESANIIRNDGVIEVYPIDSHGVERKWRFGRDTVESISNELICKKIKGEYVIQRAKKDGYRWKTVWTDEKYNANIYGTKEVNQMIDGRFSYPKSLYTVKDCIKAIIHEKSDIILDYHAGSGTTAHAVLELNKEDSGNRKFIMIEQMDYINTVTCPRVQKVMEKENIDDSFIYFELAKWNETAKEKIQEAKSLEELETFFDEMYERYFLNYNLKIKEFKEKVLQEENFRSLSLDEQKKIFVAMLDNNQMYVNKTEMADRKFGIDKKDQNLTSKFYNSEK
jgi:adenine-specific DNA-methyltransferase